MKTLLAVLATALFASMSFAQVYVPGYQRSNGVQVQPHYRSSPNATVQDNYSYRGNPNPYTGQQGQDNYRNSPSSGYYNPSK